MGYKYKYKYIYRHTHTIGTSIKLAQGWYYFKSLLILHW